MKKKNLFLSLAIGLSFILLTACASPVVEEDQDLPILDDPVMEQELMNDEEMDWEEELMWEEEMPEYDDEIDWEEEEMPEYDDEMDWEEEVMDDEMEIQVIE